MENNTGQNPLVSIIVITYNSSKYVLETLESAKAQTYQNIELIISDDCSKDDTVEVCRKWLDENSERFVRTELVTTERNTGVAPNCNRGVRMSKGDWVKLIAGDDTLLPDCLNLNIDYICSVNEDCYAVHSECLTYDGWFTESHFIGKTECMSEILCNTKYGANEQFTTLTFGCKIFAPTIFMKKSIIEEVGYFDERIRNCEDWPMWLKMTRLGYKFHYLNAVTVNYRLYASSVSGQSQPNFLFKNFFNIDYLVFILFIKEYVSFVHRFVLYYQYWVKQSFYKLQMNKKTMFYSLLYCLMMKPVNVYVRYRYKTILKQH